MKSITLVLYYFGKFPDWIDLYFDSLKRNSTINFVFYTDNNIDKYKSKNIIFKKYTFEEYIDKINLKLNINFKPDTFYKLCDIVPFYGVIHSDDIENSDFYGYGDSDLIFGDIRSFYTDEILSKYDVLSTHKDIISGHFALFRNNDLNRKMGFKISGWKEKLENSFCFGLGESNLAKEYFKENEIRQKKYFGLYKIIKSKRLIKLYFKEQYTTPFIPIKWLDDSINSEQPSVWYYKDGLITNNRDKDKTFMYIHFMNFKTSKYRHDGTTAPWEKLEQITNCTIEDMKTGIVIDEKGINPIQ